MEILRCAQDDRKKEGQNGPFCHPEA